MLEKLPVSLFICIDLVENIVNKLITANVKLHAQCALNCYQACHKRGLLELNYNILFPKRHFFSRRGRFWFASFIEILHVILFTK